MILLLFLLSLVAIFASPTNVYTSLFTIAVSYPALFLLTFKIQSKTYRGLFLYTFGLLYFLYQMRWMGLGAYHGSMIVLAYSLLSLLFAWNYWALGFFLPRNIRDLRFFVIVTLSFLFTCIEYSRLWMLSGFPFHQIGLVYGSNIYSLQLASIVGVFGLSFILLVQSLYIAKFVSIQAYPKAAMSFMLPFVIGFISYYSPEFAKEDLGDISVGIVQPGMLVEQKWDFANYEGKSLSNAKKLAMIWDNIKKVQSAKLIMLPENVLGGDVHTKQFTIFDLEEVFPADFIEGLDKNVFSIMDIMKQISTYLHNDVIFGACVNRYTSAFYLQNGKIIAQYNKKRLVPFGEYIPLGLHGLFREFGGVAEFISGSEPVVFHGDHIMLPSICFDEGYPEDFLRYRSFKPDVHVNISNDAWFAFLNLLDAHFILGVLRSVENGLYSFRCSNNGISCVISPKGEVKKKLVESIDGKMLVSDSIFFSQKIYKKRTPFSYIGNMGWTMFISILCVANLLRNKKALFLKA